MRKKRTSNLLLLILFSISAVACTQTVEEEIIKTTSQMPVVEFARAQLLPLQSSGISGVVTFSSTDEGVRVQATLTGLPEGKHGFHIHQFGDCRAADGTSAGGHFNPTEHPHSGPTSEERHMGDLGNIESDGVTASLDYVDTTIEMNLILGRGVIIHAAEDDLSSQPTGNAGGRLGCGVIGVGNPAVS